MKEILTKIKNNIGIICISFGLLAASTVLLSWFIGYWLNGIFGMKFDINSCWQGIGACGMGLVGLMKWLVDSTKNSPLGMPPNFNRPVPICNCNKGGDNHESN